MQRYEPKVPCAGSLEIIVIFFSFWVVFFNLKKKKEKKGTVCYESRNAKVRSRLLGVQRYETKVQSAKSPEIRN